MRPACPFAWPLPLLVLGAACAPVSSPTPPPGWTTFTNRDQYYQIQLPPDWKYSQAAGSHYYLDIFHSPDGNAVVENLAYNDGAPIAESANADFALRLLDQYLGTSGAPAAISISDTSMMNDGSERLTWASPSTHLSGISFLEVRAQTTLLVFSVAWADSAKSVYFNVLDQVVASYTVPP